jgi:hypothetical protein
MQLIETNIEQRGLLPLPAAALVIDIRGVSDDEVVERLNIEIADLASEMKTYNVHHWRFLTDFLSFQRIAPASAFEGRRNSQPANGNHNEQKEIIFQEEEERGLIGLVHPANSGNSLFFQDEQRDIVSGDMPFDLFEQKVDELIQEINRIRNNRIAAVADLNKAAIPGRSTRDATVRVIFLTDAENQNSLKSAAIYAERIKEYYRKRERSNHQPLVSTTALCLGNSGEVGPPKKLIEGLLRNKSWSHLDTLILSEDYREDAALIAGTVQAYLAELLLYVLLIIPPFSVNSPLPPQTAPEEETFENEGPGEWVTLPPNTFIVGLAALEYSARWGRRWLSYGLAKEVAEVLTQRPNDEMMEQRRTDGSVEVWFSGWRDRVQKTIPEKIPHEVSALEGVLNARRVAASTDNIFTTSRFGVNIGESTIKNLSDYKDSLANTYVAATNTPTLQESVLRSTPQIMHTLQAHENRTLVERKVSDLGTLQIEAEQILSGRDFFTTATGALPRARTQLAAIGTIASQFQNDHHNNPLNPTSAKNELQERRKNLIASGDEMINGLQKHLENWPFFGALLRLHAPLAILSAVLFLLVNLIIVLLGFAWLNHLLIVKNVGLVSYLDAQILGVPTLELIAWGFIVTIAIIGLLFVSRLFSYSALRVEIIFLILLFASALFGLLASYSIDTLANQALDTISIGFLTFLAFVPEYSRFAFVVGIVVLVVEIAYFIWWFTHLRNEREDIVMALSTQHQKDVKDVTNFIADDVALKILQHAELVSDASNLSSSNPFGEYYYRVDRLCRLLEDIIKKTQEQQQLAGKRLLLSQSETQEGLSTINGETWLNLHIRDEKLETEALTDGYRVLRQRIVTENATLREFAEFMLRTAGVEKPVEIGQSFEQRETRLGGEPRRLQILLTALVSSTLRFSVDPLSVKSISPILTQYKSTNEYARQHMPTLSSLIQLLSKKMSRATLQSVTDKGTATTQYLGQDTFQINMSTDAFATWAQMFWQNKDRTVDEALMQDGVLAQLMRLLNKDYDPRAVMRQLLARTSLFGRGIGANRYGELYLLLAPSTQSYEFRQGLKALKLPRIIDFPDVERMLLLGVQHYVADPLFLPERAIPTPRSNTNGLSMLDPTVEEHENTVVPPMSNGTNGTNGTTANPTAQSVPTQPSQPNSTAAPTVPLDPSMANTPPLDPTVPLNPSMLDADDANDADDADGSPSPAVVDETTKLHDKTPAQSGPNIVDSTLNTSEPEDK